MSKLLKLGVFEEFALRSRSL